MILVLLLDVNVLVYAHREDSPRHLEHKKWLEALASGDEAFSVTDLVFSGFLRVVTHPHIFDPPTSISTALKFVAQVQSSPSFRPVAPGERHWEIFTRLCQDAAVKGNLVPDAFHAAVAIESGSEWITTDGDFARFKQLRWRRPLDSRVK